MIYTLTVIGNISIDTLYTNDYFNKTYMSTDFEEIKYYYDYYINSEKSGYIKITSIESNLF